LSRCGEEATIGSTDPRPKQTIRFLRTRDGVRLAWAVAGAGPPLIKASNWLTHLEYEWDSPVWRHWMTFFSERFRFVRYDERGCGLSDCEVGELTVAHWLADLEEVLEAAEPDGPAVLLGISQGAAAAIAYAVDHPDRVSHLILYGGYAQGAAYRGDQGDRERYRAMIELARYGWASDNPTFRQVFTSRFIPGGTDEQLRWFNELCRKTISAANAARLLEMRSTIDVTGLLPRVRTPTLVLHARGDEVIPLAQGRLLATEIPGAEFVELDSRNHVLLEDEPAWRRFGEAVVDFTGVGGSRPGEDPAFAALSPREREVLGLVAEGLANAEIAERLAISDKTVRNHLSRVFDKLGVRTRAQAIVFARDRGFGT
jgi:pimeloyl-ACP methyl ester carboxylesterase/DNA-binding CsgD family transcriptional regulator